jgi:hypothetical protein
VDTCCVGWRVSDAKFGEDAKWVMKDLETLKRVLEQ